MYGLDKRRKRVLTARTVNIGPYAQSLVQVIIIIIPWPWRMMVPPGLAFPTVVYTHTHMSYIIMYRCTLYRTQGYQKPNSSHRNEHCTRIAYCTHIIIYSHIHNAYSSSIFYYSLYAVHIIFMLVQVTAYTHVGYSNCYETIVARQNIGDQLEFKSRSPSLYNARKYNYIMYRVIQRGCPRLFSFKITLR